MLYVSVLILDIPFIRGLYDPIFPSEWPYYYVNTWNRIFTPLLALLLVIVCFLWGYKNLHKANWFKNSIFWLILIISIFFLHLSYVHFSRFGITVLFQRIVNPGMNGYFSSAVRVETRDYLNNFPEVIETLDQHARDHPPGSILFIKAVTKLVDILPFVDNLAKLVPQPDGDVRIYWNSLLPVERLSAVVLAFLYHLVGASSIFLIFLISKMYFDYKKALSLSLLWGMVPSISFFALKFDSFYFLMFCVTAYVVLRAIRLSQVKLFYLGGFFISLCLFFSYSLIPGLIVLGLYVTFFYKNTVPLLIDNFVKIMIGFSSLILVLLLLGYNTFTAFFPILLNQAPRSYWQWVFYNPFDFLQYFGVSISVLFSIIVFQLMNIKKGFEIKKITIIFLFFFFVLVLSGISRAEVGRIWMPLMLFPLLAIGLYKKLSLGFLIIIVFLLFIQNIVMTEFWVPIW